MVGGNPEVRRPVFNQLQCAEEHTDYTRLRVLFGVSPELAVELPVQLVRAVNQMNDHKATLEAQY